MFALASIMEHINDHPWYQTKVWGMTVTVMSSAIGTMLLSALVLLLLVIPAARKKGRLPTGGKNVLEALVFFVRDMIAKPALHHQAYKYLPFLLTLFVFILAMNLIALLPLTTICEIFHIPPVGAAPTGVLSVTGAMACVTMLTFLYGGFCYQAKALHEHHGWPMPLCVVLGPVMWFKSLVPPVPGTIGKVLFLPLLLLEIIGAVAKVFALTIRLCANIMSGHALMASLLMLVGMAASASLHVLYVGPLCVGAGVLANILDLLVAFLQAYVFTFLSAIFIGMYTEASH